MKAKDLKPLCAWENRAPLFGDRLFYVPRYYSQYEQFQFPPWNHPTLFSKDQPICIEYCSGNGSWIAAKAQSEHYLNFVAVELRFDRVRKIWSKCKNMNLSNLFTVWGEAYTFTHHYISDQSVCKIFINFPDPWPKRSQEKHRLLTESFIFELARILRPQGTIMFVTDEETYLARTCDLFFKSPYLTPSFSPNCVVNEIPNYGTSFFDALWREKGKKIHYLELFRNDRNLA